jgi:hypothetical protein
MSNVQSLERDVLDCGVPLGEVRVLGKSYKRALQSGSPADWIELYLGTFVTLLRGANRTRSADSNAAGRMLQLLSDDLGAQLFDGEALARVAAALLRSAA